MPSVSPFPQGPSPHPKQRLCRVSTHPTLGVCADRREGDIADRSEGYIADRSEGYIADRSEGYIFSTLVYVPIPWLVLTPDKC